ncbi:hypothetical protein CVT24_006583 [Panaeolus cyanescens]|uniref:Uncharacterized protein n=1 Tax=Panaeolus cyanescens TaxID=181874 RepID=A0A409WC79_9AGAR|nr:hypothetical protein CVT24_006583 [Panaeolus cyanescens]
MHLHRSRHEDRELDGHGPRMLPPTSSRSGGHYDDRHHSSRYDRDRYEYPRDHDRGYRERESYSPPRHRSRSRHHDDAYEDHSRSDRHRDRSRHSTRHHSTHRRRESDSPSYHRDHHTRDYDDDRLRSDGHHHHHHHYRSSDHGHHSSSHRSRPAFERRRSRSVDDYFSSRHGSGRHAPVYYHYQSGSYVPIPLHGDALHGAARARATSTVQGPTMVPSNGRQPMVVPVDGGRGGWIVVPPVGHSVSVMEPKTTVGPPTSKTLGTTSSIPQPTAPVQPTTTINIGDPYQPATNAVPSTTVPVNHTATTARSTHHPALQDAVIQPVQPSIPATTSSRRRSPQQIPRMPPSGTRPRKLTVPQPLAGAPSTSPRSAGVAHTTPVKVTLAPPGHPVPSYGVGTSHGLAASGVAPTASTAYQAPYGAGNSGSVPSAAPTAPGAQRKSGFGWGFFGTGRSPRSRGTSL